MARPSKKLEDLVLEAMRRFNALPKEEQDAMWKAQRESWVRGQIALIPTDREYARKRGFSGD